MILKNKNLFFYFLQIMCIQIYHRTSSIPLMYKANMFTISFNSENDHSTFSVYLNKNHGRLFSFRRQL